MEPIRALFSQYFLVLIPNTSGHPNLTKYSTNDLINYTKGPSTIVKKI